MRFKVILFFILSFFALSSLTWSHPPRRVVGDDDDTTRKQTPAQTAKERQRKLDSAREARERIADSVSAARQHIFDSIQIARKRHNDSLMYARRYRESKRYKDSVERARKNRTATSQTGKKSPADSLAAARKHTTDSMQKARKRITDSTAAIRKYKESKHYKDSVERARTAKTKAMTKKRQATMDSVKDVRKHITDSIASSRKGKTDSIETIQKRRTDSLAKIKKYKESKRYTDSVTLVKRQRSDSVKDAQKKVRDRMAATRKKTLDSANAARKHVTDSIKTVRTAYMDSVKLVRKKRTDSLAKVKSDKEKTAKAKEKKKNEDAQLKLELKIKQKHKEWSNKKMLKKRWSPLRRFFQNSFTHYNYYYNANKKMEEAMVNMQRTRQENYDSIIGLYSFDPNRDSTLLSSDMDSIVRKVSVGIQIHDPRTKWADDLYMLLGQAYYYRGNYENASIAFRYIISTDAARKKEEARKKGYSRSSKEATSFIETRKKSFLKRQPAHNDAILWLARTFTSAGQPENAEAILSLFETEPNLPKDVKGKLATEKAFAMLAENNYEVAEQHLAVTEDDKNQPGYLRVRAAFIHGQLLQQQGRYADAARSFEKVLTYYPKLEMDFYARKYIAYNKLLAGQDVAEAMKPLKSVVNDGKYVSYYDQVYYVLGNIAAKGNRNDEAVKYYQKSTTSTKASKKQKALSYAAMGDVYYASANYRAAKNAYDSATKYGTGVKDNSVVAAVQKGKGLEEISGPSKVIHDQDSLLDLAKKSKKEQQSAVRKYLRYLEQRKADSASAAENTGVTGATAVETPDAGDPNASNWYFGNATLMQQGSIEFKRKWGNRPLTDNWRRASAAPLASGNNGRPEDEKEDEITTDGDGVTMKNGLPTEESLLSKIPNTQQQKDLAMKVQQRAYIALAKGYMKLSNYDQAIQTLDTLDMRYPTHNQKEEALYLRYQIALKENKLDKAQGYATQLLQQFPQSQYAASLKPKTSESKDNTAGKQAVAVYFDETYELLMKHQYTEVLMHINVARQQYDHPTFLKRFDVTEAMAYAGMADYNQADTLLAKFIKANPADSLTGWAKEVQIYVKEMRLNGKPSWYKETPIAEQPMPGAKKDSIAKAEPEKPKEPEAPKPPPIPEKYAYIPSSEHYAIVVIPGIDSRTMGLKTALRTLAAKMGGTVLFDLYDIDHGVLVVKQFKDAAAAKSFAAEIAATPDAMKGYAPGDIQVMAISAENYRKMYADRNAAPYEAFYRNNY